MLAIADEERLLLIRENNVDNLPVALERFEIRVRHERLDLGRQEALERVELRPRLIPRQQLRARRGRHTGRGERNPKAQAAAARDNKRCFM
jgi:hypothetical protein